MIRAYEEIIDFLAQGTTPQSIVAPEASPAAKQRVADLIAREKSEGLSADETAELDHYIEIEHLMRLAKARAFPSPYFRTSKVFATEVTENTEDRRSRRNQP